MVYDKLAARTIETIVYDTLIVRTDDNRGEMTIKLQGEQTTDRIGQVKSRNRWHLTVFDKPMVGTDNN